MQAKAYAGAVPAACTKWTCGQDHRGTARGRGLAMEKEPECYDSDFKKKVLNGGERHMARPHKEIEKSNLKVCADCNVHSKKFAVFLM